jgi:hypothetical protein
MDTSDIKLPYKSELLEFNNSFIPNESILDHSPKLN